MDGIDFTIPLHADAHGFEYVEIEIRQDLIADEKGQTDMAALLAPLLVNAAR
jgi:predicted N-formylglutamate amidohydrolase